MKGKEERGMVRERKIQTVPTAGAVENLSSSFARIHIYCVVMNNMAPIKRYTIPKRDVQLN